MSDGRHPGGRPPLPPEERKSVLFRVRLNPPEAALLSRLGGASWIRGLLRALSSEPHTKE